MNSENKETAKTARLASLFPEAWSPVVLQIGYIAVCWLFLYFLHRKGVYLKV